LRTFKGSSLLLTACLAAGCSQFGEKKVQQPQPVTQEEVTATDVAATPIQDLNLAQDKIPPLLIAARAAPYSTDGLSRCSQISSAVQEFDAVLGPDLDSAEAREREMTVGSVAKSVVGALIPFRGVIREVSGANKAEQAFQDAVIAGMMRRAFLKGMGLKLGCALPARPTEEAIKAVASAPTETEEGD